MTKRFWSLGGESKKKSQGAGRNNQKDGLSPQPPPDPPGNFWREKEKNPKKRNWKLTAASSRKMGISRPYYNKDLGATPKNTGGDPKNIREEKRNKRPSKMGKTSRPSKIRKEIFCGTRVGGSLKKIPEETTL